MNLQCPHCHTTFEVDQNHYAALLAQVRGAEFDAELNRRLSEIAQTQKAKEEVIKLQYEQRAEQNLKTKNDELAILRAEVERLRNIIDTNEESRKSALEVEAARSAQRLMEVAASKDREIADLTNRLSQIEVKHRLDLVNEQNAGRETLQQSQQVIMQLNARLVSQENSAKTHELEMQKNHEAMLKAKDAEIERLRDMRSRLSTKMLGETLEQHCLNTFNGARSMGQFADAYFEKDNDVVNGTKGDFVFRDYIDGEECLSIMFEMKTEADTTAVKHKNEHFFAKLDKDRNEKHCEYAILVSTLEADNELYNNGIVDVSYRYRKMFVVRPQFFMPVIALLSKAARRNAQTVTALRSELVKAKAQNVDVSKFEEKRDLFVKKFMGYVGDSNKRNCEAIEAVDKAIAQAEKQIDALQKIKRLFETGTQKLERAGEMLENDLTIKKLTHGNPTMRAKFEEARRNADTDLV